MSMILKIARKELVSVFRERLVVALGIIILLLLGVSISAGYVSYGQQQAQITRAHQEKKVQWINQGDKHPHIAAHYGTFVFKPKTFLSFFDFGLDAFTGTSVYLEAHYQHEFMFRPAQDQSTLIRFGELSAALVLQILLPLLLIFLCFASFTGERESGTLRLLLSQGVSMRSIAWGKILAYYLLTGALLLPVFVAASLYIWQLPEQVFSIDLLMRISLLMAGYAVYAFLFVVMAVLVSAWAHNSRNALLTLLTLWITFTMIIPKTFANLGDSLYPLPSMKEYQEAMQKDVREGLDGQTPSSVRLAALKEQYLSQYEVDSLSQLPFNFEGISLQAGEDYSNKVHDVHWQQLLDIFHQQNRLNTYMSWLNPYLAIRNFSMGLAATDFYTAIDFQNKVETYRRALIRRMNQDMAQNSRYGEFFEYKAGTTLWKEVADFTYQLPPWPLVVKAYWVEIMSLLFWLTMAILLVHFFVNKANPLYA